MRRAMSVPDVIHRVAWNNPHPLIVTSVCFGHCLELHFSPSIWKLSCISSLFMIILASDVSSLASLSIFWIRHKPKVLNALSH